MCVCVCVWRTAPPTSPPGLGFCSSQVSLGGGAGIQQLAVHSQVVNYSHPSACIRVSPGSHRTEQGSREAWVSGGEKVTFCVLMLCVCVCVCVCVCACVCLHACVYTSTCYHAGQRTTSDELRFSPSRVQRVHKQAAAFRKLFLQGRCADYRTPPPLSFIHFKS